MSHPVTVQLDDDSFSRAPPWLQHMFGIAGMALVTFMSLSERVNALFDRFTSEHVVTLMSNSVAARLEDPRFMTAFNAVPDRFTSEQVVTLSIKGKDLVTFVRRAAVV